MHKSGNQHPNHRDNCTNRSCDAAKCRCQFSNQACPVLNRKLELSEALRQFDKALHCHADFGYRRSQNHQKRPNGGDNHQDSEHSLSRAFIHIIQPVHKALNRCDSGANCRHQHFAKRNCQLLQLAFQNRDLPGQIVLHGICHFLCDTVTI